MSQASPAPCTLAGSNRLNAWTRGTSNINASSKTPASSHTSTPRFPWLQKLEENAATVQQELKEALQMGEMLDKTGNNVWIGALTAEGAAYGPDWKVRTVDQDGER